MVVVAMSGNVWQELDAAMHRVALAPLIANLSGPPGPKTCNKMANFPRAFGGSVQKVRCCEGLVGSCLDHVSDIGIAYSVECTIELLKPGLLSIVRLSGIDNCISKISNIDTVELVKCP
jgi:hypothetical protein